MAPKRSSEFEKIASIERILRAKSSRAVELAIGDDAALLRVAGRVVWTVDVQVAGVHFDLRWLTLEDVGYRSFQAAASDLAAMGARPIAALSSLALPASLRDSELTRLVKGQAAASRRCGCPIVGGNLSKAGELSVTTTLLGAVTNPLLRSGARSGDELWLVGEVGAAALGFRALSGKARQSADVRSCVQRWRRPEARLREGLALVGRAHAALDVSDGLAGDAGHLAKASRVRVVLDAERIEACLPPAFRRAAPRLGFSALELALFGGEDYALLCAGPSARRPRFARPIGHVEAGGGVWLEQAGQRKKLAGAFDHFLK